MVERRELTARERLDSYIDFGLRDAKDRPDVPALTLTQKCNSRLIGAAFDYFEEPISSDVTAQAETVKKYIETKGCFSAQYEIIEDRNLDDSGFNIYLKINGHVDKSQVEGLFLHPESHGMSKEEVVDLNRKLDVCEDCRKVVRDVVKFY